MKNGLFYGIINGDETIAISDDIDAVASRLKRADSNIDYTIYDTGRRRRYTTIESYYNSLLPRIYRITSSNTKDHDVIIAMNRVISGRYSSIQLFYDVDDLHNFFEQLKNKNYYVHVAHFRDISREDKKRFGGIDALDVPREWRKVADLQAVIKARQKAGSHEAYIKQLEQAKAQLSRNNQYFYDGERDWSIDDGH